MQSALFKKIIAFKTQLNSCVLGQEELIESVLVGIFAQGHILLSSVPGLAKSTLAQSIAKSLNLSFKRIQFTPDLIPSDILGAQIYNPATNQLQIHLGPIFANVVLADEINRAPAKVQSALLEAMQEKQVTLGNDSYLLPQPFVVVATANPIESQGVYVLPEAQLDRFMLCIHLEYPSSESEIKILKNMHTKRPDTLLDSYDLELIKKHIENIYVEESLYKYIVDLAQATRKQVSLKGIDSCLQLGVSPRASIDLLKASQAFALLQDRDYLIPSDVLRVLPLVFSHRILLGFEAKSMGISAQDILQEIIALTPIP